jgi:hypothetical protein
MFRGRVVSEAGIRLDSAKVDGLASLACLADISGLCSVLGLAKDFRDFAPGFSRKVARMEELLSPKVPFLWTEVRQKEFQELKRSVMEAGILYTVDYQFPLVVRIDALIAGVKAVLFLPVEGAERPSLAFVSQKFSGAASRWSTIDQEVYVVVFAVYLRGHQFVIQTDHHNLFFIMSSLSGRVGRWRLELQEYDYLPFFVSMLGAVDDEKVGCWSSWGDCDLQEVAGCGAFVERDASGFGELYSFLSVSLV